MRKHRSIWMMSAFLLAGLFAHTLLAAIQFYKPNRGARLIVYLKAKEQYSAWSHVVMTVMLNNQTQGSLLINSRMRVNTYPRDGELSFMIVGPNGKEYPLRKSISPRDILAGELSLLGVGETTEQTVDLTDLYDIGKRGRYRIQVLYYNTFDTEKDGLKTWRGVIASEPAEITLK